ncbi:hypothetical protein BH09PLA1_BH09PLA1_12810 [soil metagenome]
MSKSKLKRNRMQLFGPIDSSERLHRWIKYFIGIDIPRQPVCSHHQAPFAYIRHAYFEPTKDVVVVAPRGGGKTRLAAVATLLDLLHKPPCDVRILGGSLDQSLRMWEHLLPQLEDWAAGLLMKRVGASKKIELTIGSTAAVLTQSQRAVRGLHMHRFLVG